MLLACELNGNEDLADQAVALVQSSLSVPILALSRQLACASNYRTYLPSKYLTADGLIFLRKQ